MTKPEPSSATATRAAYDTVAADYADRLRDELADRLLDRGRLAAFAELVQGADGDSPAANTAW